MHVVVRVVHLCRRLREWLGVSGNPFFDPTASSPLTGRGHNDPENSFQPIYA